MSEFFSQSINYPYEFTKLTAGVAILFDRLESFKDPKQELKEIQLCLKICNYYMVKYVTIPSFKGFTLNSDVDAKIINFMFAVDVEESKIKALFYCYYADSFYTAIPIFFIRLI